MVSVNQKNIKPAYIVLVPFFYIHYAILANLLLVRFNHRVDRVLGYFSIVRIGTPPPSLAGECVPSHFGSGGEHIRWGERMWGGVPIRAMGQTLWYSRYICTLRIKYSFIIQHRKIFFLTVLSGWSSFVQSVMKNKISYYITKKNLSYLSVQLYCCTKEQSPGIVTLSSLPSSFPKRWAA